MEPLQSRPLDVLAVSGSLRRASMNSGLLRELAVSAPDSLRIDVLGGLGQLPLFNPDLMADGVLPEPVVRVRERLGRADAVVVACPEYCYGVTAPLKNFVDWVSFPAQYNCFRFKPVGLVGASPGPHGTLRSQQALRLSMQFLEAFVMPRPEVYVCNASTKFDADGNLVDDETKKLLASFIADFEDSALVTLSRRLDPANREFRIA